MTSAIRNRILDITRVYGTGRDTLRCLALATLDHPMKPESMDFGDSSKFADYEVSEFLLNKIKLYFYLFYLAKHDFCRCGGNVRSSTKRSS